MRRPSVFQNPNLNRCLQTKRVTTHQPFRFRQSHSDQVVYLVCHSAIYPPQVVHYDFVAVELGSREFPLEAEVQDLEIPLACQRTCAGLDHLIPSKRNLNAGEQLAEDHAQELRRIEGKIFPRFIKLR